MTIEQLIAALKVDITQAIVTASLAIAAEIQDKIAPYPPAGPGNQPRSWLPRGHNSWYQRGSGPKWVVRSGAIHGRNSSETLGRRWSIEARPAGAVLGNIASYAPYVHSQDQQSATMARIGWITDKTAVETVMSSPVVNQIITQAIAHAFASRVPTP